MVSDTDEQDRPIIEYCYECGESLCEFEVVWHMDIAFCSDSCIYESELKEETSAE